MKYYSTNVILFGIFIIVFILGFFSYISIYLFFFSSTTAQIIKSDNNFKFTYNTSILDLKKKLTTLYISSKKTSFTNFPVIEEDSLLTAFQNYILQNYQNLYYFTLDKYSNSINEHVFYSYYLKYLYLLPYESIFQELYYTILSNNQKFLKIIPLVSDNTNIVFSKYSYFTISNQLPFNFSFLTRDKTYHQIGIFLENYTFKQESLKPQFIKNVIKKYSNINNLHTHIQSEKKIKELFKSLWKLGLYLTFHTNNQTIIPIESEIKLFDQIINYLISYLNQHQQSQTYPFNYDWFLFSSYYPTILCYKLYLDLYLFKTINKTYLTELFTYIPDFNYSKHLSRTQSNASILSMNYIIGQFFLHYHNYDLFQKKISKFFHSNIFQNHIKLHYKLPSSRLKSDGLYPDGGFITHQNLTNYNYLIAYFYPSLFYHLLFNCLSENIEKIFETLSLLINFQTQKVHPSIVSRFGTFDEIYNFLSNALFLIKDLGLTPLFQQNINISNLFKIFFDQQIQKNELFILHSSNILIAIFQDWNIQLKINSELAYGEIDIYNTAILKQIWMSKILIIKHLDIQHFDTHSKYPGVISHELFLHNSQHLSIKKGTKTFTLFKNFYASGILINQEYAFIYTEITNHEFFISYDELIIITPFGIIVCYFNIEYLNVFLSNNYFLTINNHIYNNEIDSNIIYSDHVNPEIINENNKFFYVHCNKNIIYSNFLKKFNQHIQLQSIIFNNAHILFSFIIDNKLFTANIYKEKQIIIKYESIL